MNNKLCKEQTENIVISQTNPGRVLYFEEVTSTFDKIREYDLINWLTVVSSKQTNGSGRLGRKWESPPGGVYFTLCLAPPFDVPPESVTPVCAAGIHRALSKYADCSIKWPNDIVSGGKKICGILTRNIVFEGKITAVLVGVGINVNTDSFPADLPHATSLKLISDKEVNENAVFCHVLKCICQACTCYTYEENLRYYKAKCINTGKEVTVHFIDGRKDANGICTDILSDGSMNVTTPDGVLNVNSGEVSVKGIYDFERNDNK